MAGMDLIDRMLGLVDDLLDSPDQFLRPPKHLPDQLKNFTEELYNFTKSTNLTPDPHSKSLPKLFVNKNVDDEQIWQQLVIQNELCKEKLFGDVSKVLKAHDRGTFVSLVQSAEDEDDFEDEEEDEEDLLEDDDDEEDNEMDEDDLDLSLGAFNDDNEDAMSDISVEMEKALDKHIASLGELGTEEEDENEEGEENDAGENEIEDESDEEGVDKENVEQEHRFFGRKQSSVDDRFFKLKQLETFLETEDAKEMWRQKNENSKNEDEEEDESVNLFQDFDNQKLKYDDFFDPPEDENLMLSKGKKVSFQLPIDNDRLEDEEDEFEDEDEEEPLSNKLKMSSTNEEKSSFEIRQEKLMKKIKELEQASLAEKPWQLKGEVGAHIRPENSLLEEHLQFDHMSRPAPVITVEWTKKLEDMIKQRIKDQAWDDVEKKVKPKEDAYEFRKKIVLDQEKSKLSLAEVYEQEYVKQQQQQNENKDENEVPKEHEAIKKEMKLLFDKLDALSNYCYVPKQPVPEVKIVNNLPAIVVEEVVPVGVSDAALLAPEEIKNKARGETKGKMERSESDKRHERRKKKSLQRFRQKRQENKEKLLAKKTKENEENGVESSVKVDRKKFNKTKSSLTSSKDFFSKLQGKIEKSVNNEKTKKKSAKKQFSSSDIKL